jgi:hypothetical protein
MSSMTFVLSGASGLVGSALRRALEARKYRVVRLVRRSPTADGEVEWDPARGSIDKRALEGADAFIHLSGENVGEGRWTEQRKRSIIESRTLSTGLLARTIVEAKIKPGCFVSASAIGFYGSDHPQPVDESGTQGGGFLAEVCKAWEDAAEPASSAGVRTVLMRLGVVLSKEGGALAKLLPIFRVGAGGPAGSGEQVMSWISLADAVSGFRFAAEHDGLVGPVNLVAPDPVDNRTFARTLGRVLGRPSLLRVPTIAIETLFGQMGKETILASQRAVPRKLLDAGFEFAHPNLEGALRAELGR